MTSIRLRGRHAAAVFGAVVGSFLNVCIYRLPRGESIVWPPLALPALRAPSSRRTRTCPVVSWLALRGRCRGVPGAHLAAVPARRAGDRPSCSPSAWLVRPTPLLPCALLFACAMIVLVRSIDLEQQLLPNVITLPGIVVGLVGSLFLPPGLRRARSSAPPACGVVLWGIGEVVSRVLGKEALGIGDVKMVGDDRRVPRLAVDADDVRARGVGRLGSSIVRRGGHRRNRDYAHPARHVPGGGALVAAFRGPRLIDWYLDSFSGLPR